MPSHSTMWMMAGGSALASACLTYAMTRPVIGSTVSAASSNLAGLFRTGYGAAHSAFRKPSHRAGRARNFATSDAPVPSHNAAFAEYRQATLDRLADDERAFQNFLDRLRHAKDRAEFDQFMSNRRSGATRSEPSGTSSSA